MPKMSDKRWRLLRETGAILVELPWSESFDDIIAKESVTNVMVNDVRDTLPGLTGPLVDISFVAHLPPTISSITLNLMRPIRELQPLLRFAASLQEIRITYGWARCFDWSDFRSLRLGRFMAGPGSHSVLSCPMISDVELTGFNGQIDRLPGSETLRRLCLIESDIRNTEGIARFPHLLELYLLRCRRLRHLQLETLRQLELLHIDHCSSVDDISCLSELSELKELSMRSVGKVQSIKPLAKCRKLRSILMGGSTDIVDGDLDVLVALPDLIGADYISRSHYSMTPQTVERVIESRWGKS